MSTAPTAGNTARNNFQPPAQLPGQPPAPDAPPPGVQPADGAPPAPPQLRNLSPGSDPRGRKRGREDDNADNREPSTEPVLKQARTEPSPPPESPEIAIFHAIDAGDITTLQSLLSRYPALINTRYPDAHGETPLCRAARCGQRDIVNRLLRMGADVNARASNGSTPLMFAAQTGYTDVIRQLCRKGADVNAVNVSLSARSALFFAARANQLEACKCLVELGANLSAKSDAGESCLLWAAAANSSDVVQWLLEQRIRIDEPDHSGNTALMHACRAGHLEMVRLLVAHGADLAARNTDGDTCVAYAAAYNRVGVVNWLLEQGAPPDKPDADGVTPIMHAFSQRHWDVVHLLLQCDVKLPRSSCGGICLKTLIASQAAREGQYQILILLRARFGSIPIDGLPVTSLQRAAISELGENFKYLQSGDKLDTEGWLSDSLKPARGEFVLHCTRGSTRKKLVESKKSALSPLINTFLEFDLADRKFHALSAALSGKEKAVQLNQERNIILFLLKSLKNSSRIAELFSDNHLSPEQEARVNQVLNWKLDGLLLSLTELLPLEQSDFVVQFTRLCEKYLKITGRFDSEAFNKALCKHFGLYQVNADRLTVLVGQALEAARRKPLELAPAENAGQTVHLIGRQLMDSWLGELRTTVEQSSDDLTLPGFAKGLEMLLQIEAPQALPREELQDEQDLQEGPEQDSLEGSQEDLQEIYDRDEELIKLSLHSVEWKIQAAQQTDQQQQIRRLDPTQRQVALQDEQLHILLQQSLSKQLESLPQWLQNEKQQRQVKQPDELYVDMIFGQWRQISAAFGVVLPEWKPSGQ